MKICDVCHDDAATTYTIVEGATTDDPRARMLLERRLRRRASEEVEPAEESPPVPVNKTFDLCKTCVGALLHFDWPMLADRAKPEPSEKTP